MLNYTETASRSTIVSLTSQSQCQQDAAYSVSSVFSYAISPINPAHLLTQQACLSDREEITLFIPADLPHTVINDPEFKDGYECGYLDGDFEGLTVPQLVNQIFWTLALELHGEDRSGFYAWTVGILVGSLAGLAESDQTLVLVGVNHLCALLSCQPLEAGSCYLESGMKRMEHLHQHAIDAYRARVHPYRWQGKSYDEAQRLALC